MDELVSAVTAGPGRLDRQLRLQAFQGHAMPAEIAGYAAKVRDRAYTVTDDDVRAVVAAGWSEDEVFELTVALALGAGHLRLRAAADALDAARDEAS
jgi:hypothetical protein